MDVHIQKWQKYSSQETKIGRCSKIPKMLSSCTQVIFIYLGENPIPFSFQKKSSPMFIPEGKSWTQFTSWGDIHTKMTSIKGKRRTPTTNSHKQTKISKNN